MTDREPVNIMGVFAFPDPDKDKRVIRFIDSDYHTLFTIRDGESIVITLSPSWITASTAECGGWCMSAVTTSTETVSPWTMGRNVSVSSLFPTPCCAGGFGRRYCRRIRNWKRRCSTG